MSRRTRRTHSPSFKAKVALVAVRGGHAGQPANGTQAVRRGAAAGVDKIRGALLPFT